jgi:hypothetical protein
VFSGKQKKKRYKEADRQKDIYMRQEIAKYAKIRKVEPYFNSEDINAGLNRKTERLIPHRIQVLLFD